MATVSQSWSGPLAFSQICVLAETIDVYISAFTSFETNNKYKVFTPQGQIFLAAEGENDEMMSIVKR